MIGYVVRQIGWYVWNVGFRCVARYSFSAVVGISREVALVGLSDAALKVLNFQNLRNASWVVVNGATSVCSFYSNIMRNSLLNPPAAIPGDEAPIGNVTTPIPTTPILFCCICNERSRDRLFEPFEDRETNPP